MKNKIDLEFIKEIARTALDLSKLKEELNRYYKEEYLHEIKDKHPWITVNMGNHPTYLSDFIVNMNDDNLRDSIVNLAIQQIKMSIKELEKKLEELLKKEII